MYFLVGAKTIYRCCDGRYYGDVDVWERLESNVWTPCCWDAGSGTEWMETRAGDLLTLTPVPREALPAWLRTERVAAGLSVVAETRGGSRWRRRSDWTVPATYDER